MNANMQNKVNDYSWKSLASTTVAYGFTAGLLLHI